MMTFSIPIKVQSSANLREHWAAKAKRVKQQRTATAFRWPTWKSGPLLVVRLTRCAPRSLDGDNLQGALKGIRDEVAAKLRIDDASPLVRWDYQQEKAPKGSESVRVEVMSPGEAAEAVVTPETFARLARPIMAAARRAEASEAARLDALLDANAREEP